MEMKDRKALAEVIESGSRDGMADVDWQTLTAAPRPRQPRPIVIIGAGSIVHDAHLPAYRKAGFPVVAIADVLPDKAAALAAAYEVDRSFGSVSECIRFAPRDAVFDLAVPAPYLRDVLRQLPDGAVALLQKPMGETIEEAGAILELCRQKNLIAAVNFQLRYAPVNLAAQALYQQGALGQLHDMEVQVRTHTPWAQWSFLQTAPRLEILYHSIHYLDLVRSWLGNPESISAKTVRHPAVGHLAATKTVMFFDYGNAMRVFIATNHGFRQGKYDCSFVQWEGAAGAMRGTIGANIDYPRGVPDELDYSVAQSGGGWRQFPVGGNWFPDAFMGSMGALQAFVEGSANALPSSVDDAYQTMALVEAAYCSSDAGGHTIEWSQPAS